MKVFHPIVAIAIITVVIALIYATVKHINRSNVADPPNKIAYVLKDKLLKSRPRPPLKESLEVKKNPVIIVEMNDDSGKAIQSSSYLKGKIRQQQGNLKHIRKYCAHWLSRQPNMVYAWLWELPGSVLHL